MENFQVAENIKRVLDEFGMSAKKAAEVTGIPYGQIRKKLAGVQGHYFHEHHYDALVQYIKAKATEL